MLVRNGLKFSTLNVEKMHKILRTRSARVASGANFLVFNSLYNYLRYENGDNIIRRKFRKSAHLIVFVLVVFSGAKSQAEPLNVTFAELSTAIDGLASEPDALKRLVLQKIQVELSAANPSFSAGELLFSETTSNLASDSSCNRTEVREVTTNVTLDANTGVDLSLESLNDPIRVAINLDARLYAEGQARQVFGFRLNGCRTIGSDSDPTLLPTTGTE